MKIRVLGCWGGVAPGQGTVGFLVNDRLLLDAGTVASALPAASLDMIDDVVLSHAHLDHIKELPFLVSDTNLQRTLRIHGTQRVLSQVRRHLFNGQIWPDFSILPTPEKPFVSYHPWRAGKPTRIAGLTIEPVPVSHSVPCTGMILTDAERSIAWTSDTGPTEKIWQAARRSEAKAVIVEVSYPNGQGRLARMAGHLTTNLLLAELRKLDMPGVPLYVYHMKPEHAATIRRELMAVKNPVIALEQGHTYEF
jgi:ribonuclease BN (tRNA processing enzyme)